MFDHKTLLTVAKEHEGSLPTSLSQLMQTLWRMGFDPPLLQSFGPRAPLKDDLAYLQTPVGQQFVRDGNRYIVLVNWLRPNHQIFIYERMPSE